MTPTDDQLSAFLDGELPAAEMDAIRQAIASDEALSERLATLASADHAVKSTYSRIDDEPMAPGLSALVQSLEAASKGQAAANANNDEAGNENQSASNVVKLRRQEKPVAKTPPWQWLSTAAAAGVLGFALASLLPGGGATTDTSWAAMSSQLDTASTGERLDFGEGTLEVRLSFANNQGHYCRQFDVQHPSAGGQYIACKAGSTWQLHAKLPLAAQPDDQYQTANVNPLLDTLLDSTMQGAPLNAEQEQVAKARAWQ